MSEEKSKFGHLRQAMATATNTKEDTKGSSLSRRLSRSQEQDNVVSAAQVDLEKSAFYQTLIDSALDPEEKVRQNAEKLAFSETDLEGNPERIGEIKAIIAKLVTDLTQFSKEGLRMIREAPLSELGADINENFSGYRDLLAGRADLLNKLTLIDQIMEEFGGSEGLVEALLNAKDKDVLRAEMQEILKEMQIKVTGLTGDVRDSDAQIRTLSREVTEAEGDKLLFFKGEKKEELRRNKEKLTESKVAREQKVAELDESRTALDIKNTEYSSLVNSEDFRLQEKILEILSMGSEDFKGQISSLAQLTLDYIESTGISLTESGKQIAVLADRADKLVTNIQNTGEQVNVLLESVRASQEINRDKLIDVQGRIAGASGIEKMKHEKIETALNVHITETVATVESTSLVSQQLGTLEVAQVAYQRGVKQAQRDTEGQLLRSTSNAGITGIATLSRIEAFAASVPVIIANGQYAKDTAFALGQIGKEFERNLAAQIAQNTNIDGIVQNLDELRATLVERNDIEEQIKIERSRLVDDMADRTRLLADANKDMLSMEARVNNTLYGKDADPETAPAVRQGGFAGGGDNVVRMAMHLYTLCGWGRGETRGPIPGQENDNNKKIHTGS